MKSPGHREHPEHAVRQQRVSELIRVIVDGSVLASAKDVIAVNEDGHPKRYYFPRTDVDMKQLQHTEKSTECPFKGTAHYYSVRTAERVLENVAWSYEDPYEEHSGLAGLLAFDDDRDGIQIQAEPS